jgi:hypothetical protein
VDLGDLPPGRVAQDQPVVQGQHLAVHVQDGLALLVGDVGVLTQSEEALADQVHPVLLAQRRVAVRAHVRSQDGPRTRVFAWLYTARL